MSGLKRTLWRICLVSAAFAGINILLSFRVAEDDAVSPHIFRVLETDSDSESSTPGGRNNNPLRLGASKESRILIEPQTLLESSQNLTETSQDTEKIVLESIKEKSDVISTKQTDGEILTDNQRPCRVLVKNEVDFHHEVIESAVLRFPLPWHEFNCTTSKPIIYDFSLYRNRFLIGAGVATSLSRNAKYLNETEFWGWKKYFEGSLQHKVFDRHDESGVPTKAYFNDFVSYLDIKRSQIDATIDVTCDHTGRFVDWLEREKHNYCVLHGANKEKISKWPHIVDKSCFLSPMWPENQCKFIAADLPKFDQNDKIQTRWTEVKICVQGANRNLTLASELFSKIPYQQYNATLHVSGRYNKHQLKKSISKFNLGSSVTTSVEIDFVLYHKMLSQCDIVLPLTDPLDRPSHYPWGGKKSSGIVPSLVAYKLPAVVHKEFAKIYRHQLAAPLEEYDDTFESKVEALKKMLVQVHSEKTRALLKT